MQAHRESMMRCWVGHDKNPAGSAVCKHNSVYRGVCCDHSWRIEVFRSIDQKAIVQRLFLTVEVAWQGPCARLAPAIVLLLLIVRALVAPLVHGLNYVGG